MATPDQLYAAIRAADAAGDANAVRVLAAQLNQGGDPAKPQDDPALDTVKKMIASGATTRDIHRYLQGIGHDSTQGVDEAVAFREAHPDQAGQIGIAPGANGGAVTAPKLENTGFLDTLGRSLANGVTGGFGDKIVSGINAVAPLDALTGKKVHSIWDGSSLSGAYNHNLDLERGVTGADDAAHPVASVGGNAVGALMSPINKIAAPFKAIQGGGAIAGAARALGGDALYGAAYGAGQSNSTTWGGQGIDALEGAGAGAVGSMLGQGIVKGISRVAAPMTDAAVQRLAAAGITMSPGQVLGGIWKSAEDKLTSVPIVGAAIQSARTRSLNDFGLAAVNEALAPIKTKLPEDVTGNEAMGFAQKAFDDVYAKARAGMGFTPDAQFVSEVKALKDQVFKGGADSLSPQYRKQFIDVLEGTVGRRVDKATGMMSGDVLKTVQSSIERKAAQYSAGNNPADMREFGSALKDLANIIDQTARRSPNSTPEAIALMDRADAGYAILARVENGARMRGGEVGLPTPNQLDRAVQTGDKTARNRAYLRGDALGQEFAAAGKKVLPSKYPDSGTAGREMLGHAVMGIGGIGAGAGAEYEREQGNYGLAGALGAGAISAGMYSRPGTKMLQSLLTARNPFVRGAGNEIRKGAPVAGRLLGAGTNAFLALPR